ncbi:MAG TPA: alpha/beta hydrolase [Hyphomicrobiaceae bacterium]|nr:alpha/beta hydrolase [Hyphomicrobiaceae bacterium]
MSDRDDYEAQYNNRDRVPDHVDINARWSAASRDYRLRAAAQLNIAYGAGARQRYDLFGTGSEPAPLIVYIHGGYWQRGDREDYAFLARELNAAGIAVALPSYSLCPAVTVMDIVGELRAFLAHLWQRAKVYPLIIGHSAGGHLTAAMLATDWRTIDGVPADLVRAGYAVSGVFDLPPLVGTSLNVALKLSAAEAQAASPMFWPPPPKQRVFAAAVGGLESEEFLRQSREIARTWRQAGVTAEDVLVPGTNHFTIVDELARPTSPMFKSVVALARTIAAR